MKKKGSAIILTVLLLGFFTAMSLNIYYIGQKKAETAGDKKAGEQLTNDIDIASSIIYQEAYLAENFVRTGVLYDLDKYGTDLSGFDDYELKNGDNSYFDVSDGTYDKEYPGIQLSSISEYFDSNWNYKLDNDGNETGAASQKLIMSEVVEDGEAESRIWQSGGVPSKITKLWEDTSLLSIGGYELVSITVNGSEIVAGDITESEVGNKLDGSKVDNKMTAVFTKTVTIEGSGDISSMTFVITATESFSVDATSGKEFSKLAYYDAVMSLSIEKQ
jgi:hypothetical protein